MASGLHIVQRHWTLDPLEFAGDMLRLVLTWLLSLGPEKAIDVVTVFDRPIVRHTLRAIAWRESAFQRVGVHAIDDGWGRVAYQRALDRGRLCGVTIYGSSARWSTRGAFGLMAAYNVPRCVPPEALDIPLFSAWLARRKLLRFWKRGGISATRRWVTRRRP